MPRKIAHPGQQLSAQFVNDLSAAVYRLQGMTAVAPLELNNSGGAPLLRFVDPRITAMLDDTGYGVGYAFSWHEVQPDGAGGYKTAPGGRSGTGKANPAYERNGCAAKRGQVVTLCPGLGSEYVFDAPVCSPASSSSSSSSSSTSGSSSSGSSGSSSSITSSSGSSSSSSSSGSSSSSRSSSSSSSASSHTSSSSSSSGVSSTSTSSGGSSSSGGGCSPSICVVTDVQCVGGSLVVTKKCYQIVNGLFCEVIQSSSSAGGGMSPPPPPPV